MRHLPDALRQMLAGNDHLIVSVRAIKEAPYEQFLEVMDGVKRAEAPRVLVEMAPSQ